MRKRVAFIIAAVWCALSLLAGCTRTAGPDPEQGGDIRFRAESALLRGAAARADLKQGPTFVSGDEFIIFGLRHGGSPATETLVFNGVTVRQGVSSLDYTPHRFWFWEGTSDWYDFVGVYPSDKGTVRMNIPGNLALSTHYDITLGDNYDLMASAYRRNGNVLNRNDRVPMAFSHMNSAVSVVFINNSEDKGVTLNSFSFTNLVVCGDLKATLDNIGDPLLSWISTERSAATVREVTPAQAIAAGSRYSGDFDLMIPQRLDQAVGAGGLEANMPKLHLDYTPQGGSATQKIVSLKDVQRQDGTVITSWEPGIKYTYYLSIRLDGGVLVNLVTTEWDAVDAETPGLLI